MVSWLQTPTLLYRNTMPSKTSEPSPKRQRLVEQQVAHNTTALVSTSEGQIVTARESSRLTSFLPQEMLLAVASFLDPRDMASLCRVTRSLHCIIMGTTSIWKELAVRKYAILEEVSRSLLASNDTSQHQRLDDAAIQISRQIGSIVLITAGKPGIQHAGCRAWSMMGGQQCVFHNDSAAWSSSPGRSNSRIPSVSRVR